MIQEAMGAETSPRRGSKRDFGDSLTPRTESDAMNGKRTVRWMALVALVATLWACSQELTRAEAKKAIETRLGGEEVTQLSPVNMTFSDLENHGLLSCPERKRSKTEAQGGFVPIDVATFFGEHCELTTKGKEHLQPIHTSHMFTVVQPVKRRLVEFVGIPQGSVKPSSTIAEFTWAYDSPDDVVATLLAGQTFEGQAVFSLYDDGWHLTRLNFSK
jgi:hypothetical protein